MIFIINYLILSITLVIDPFQTLTLISSQHENKTVNSEKLSIISQFQEHKKI